MTGFLGIATLFVTFYVLRFEGDEDVFHLRCAHHDVV